MFSKLDTANTANISPGRAQKTQEHTANLAAWGKGEVDGGHGGDVV